MLFSSMNSDKDTDVTDIHITLKDSGFTTVIYMHEYVFPNFIAMIFGFVKFVRIKYRVIFLCDSARKLLVEYHIH